MTQKKTLRIVMEIDVRDLDEQECAAEGLTRDDLGLEEDDEFGGDLDEVESSELAEIVTSPINDEEVMREALAGSSLFIKFSNARVIESSLVE